jgi:hypothetical protein
MARCLIAALLITSVAVQPTAAQEIVIPDQVAEAADKAEVEALDLLGAVNTTGSDPYEYLYSVGELARPKPPAPVFTIWDRVAECESQGNWAANTNNGFYGGVQFDHDSWISAGGGKYAYNAHLATRGQQIEIANQWLTMTSWKSWPACSLRLGLRR